MYSFLLHLSFLNFILKNIFYSSLPLISLLLLLLLVLYLTLFIFNWMFLSCHVHISECCLQTKWLWVWVPLQSLFLLSSLSSWKHFGGFGLFVLVLFVWPICSCCYLQYCGIPSVSYNLFFAMLAILLS